ncbi:LLM class flavin-dependent oxidoreductase [Pseudomonas sp. dw_358]|uniref:LLM class flavin-dependent oxidoreductase n=1 Tax=Pseudomonas sp. dw_358 TaxID=2720083 RepID=UPI001BD20755|nr:LLM class flavin-dependent oxidoreductase [Pseudomonas sp. dw_358]
MQFSTWATSASGSFLRAKVDQVTDWSYGYNLALSQAAEAAGFFGILFPVRYSAPHTKAAALDGQLDPMTLAAAVAAQTTTLRLITAILPGFVPAATMAKVGATLDQISHGRWHINLVTGWFKEEQQSLSVPWVDHADRYRRSEEYLQVLKGLWQEEAFSFAGDFYQISNATMRPRPVQQPYPAIFQGGNSPQAQQMAGQYSDWYFINGGPPAQLRQQIDAVTAVADQHGRSVRFSVNAFVIARETEALARAEYDEILAAADELAIAQFREKAKEARGMWQNDDGLASFVANNEGLRTGLVGSYEQVAERIRELEAIGLEMILLSFRFPLEEIPVFHRRVSSLLGNA